MRARCCPCLQAWIRFSVGTDCSGAGIDGMKDPRREELETLAKEAVADSSAPRATRFVRTFMGDALADNTVFVQEVEGWLARICKEGTAVILAGNAAP